MVRTIIIWLFVAIVIIFLIVWIISGGIGRGIEAGKKLFSPGDLFSGNASGTAFTLPWQSPVEAAPIEYGDDQFGENSGGSDQLSELQNQYDSLKDEAERVKLFGTPSPLVGKVSFSGGDATATDASLEYLQIQNTGDKPIITTGWSIQSAYTGVRVPFPTAASPLVTGSVNALQPATIQPGQYALIVTGGSPVGVSFQTNSCTGYLQQFQRFNPPLYENCPNPSEELQVTPENLQTYGETCIDYVRSLPSCHFPTANEIPPTISASCRSYVGNVLSYNGCVAAHRGDNGFSGDWRFYLNTQTELWKNGHDIIRLLDESGRTIDVFAY